MHSQQGEVVAKVIFINHGDTKTQRKAFFFIIFAPDKGQNKKTLCLCIFVVKTKHTFATPSGRWERGENNPLVFYGWRTYSLFGIVDRTNNYKALYSMTDSRLKYCFFIQYLIKPKTLSGEGNVHHPHVASRPGRKHVYR